MGKWMPSVVGGALLAGLIAFAVLKGESSASGRPAAQNETRPASESTSNGKDARLPMLLIPAGSFSMGDPNGADDATPVHPIQISAFYMDTYEVTQSAYESLMGVNPSKHLNPAHPVERVTWQKAAQFCNARSRAEGLTPCYEEKTWARDPSADGYRLPTEAEWEYACRAGSAGTFFFGSDRKDLGEYAWTMENSGGAPHPVGGKKPNPWGLYDILGNVWEWVDDRYQKDYYAHSPTLDPPGPETGWRANMRGGSWNDRYKACRSAERKYNEDPDQTVVCDSYDVFGFRCVRRAKGSAAGAGEGRAQP